MILKNDRKITITTAGNRRSMNWQPSTLMWSELVQRVSVFVRGSESHEDYLKSPKRTQDDLKDVGGFVGGTLTGHRRKASAVTGHDLVTLDLDNIPAGGTEDVLRRLDGLGCSYAVYSTRKHEPARPRLRCLFPLDRTVTADEYEPIARKLASIIGIGMADPTTFETSRLMYWPSASADSTTVAEHADKAFIRADGILAMYTDWHDIAEWPRHPDEAAQHVRLAAKQTDPTTKRGVVGAFCRQYDIYAAMEKFLPGIYTKVDDKDDRFTYAAGSTVGGAIVYENGLYLYSHHATDPCSGQLVNSFDLIRLHKFGDLDDEAKPETPINRLPSYTRMCAFALEDDAVAGELSQSRYDQLAEDFGDVPGDKKEKTNKPNAAFMRQLRLHPATGLPEKTIENILVVLEGDQRLKGRIRMNTFADSIFGQAPLPWAPRDQETDLFLWTEDDDSGLLIYLEKLLNFQSADKLKHALSQCAMRNRFNPVTDYLEKLKHDGRQRLDTLFIDYLGAEDTPYVRAVTRKAFIAAVARAMQPGIKYDTMPVLTGRQGIGKTTLIQKMGRNWFSNSIESFEGKDAAELLQGVWLVEIGEMSAYKKSDLDTIKGFLSRTDDQYRAAYARKTEKHPRRCVFFGTSNRDDYLRDPTGGRRFLPIDVGVRPATKNVFTELDDEVDQLWAEAVARWRLGESLFLTGELEKEARRQQEEHSAEDPWEGVIREFLERPVPVNWNKRSIHERKIYWSGEFDRPGQSVETAHRDRVCAQEIWVECLGNNDLRFMKRTDTMKINDVLDKIKDWKKKRGPRRYGPYGNVKGGYFYQ